MPRPKSDNPERVRQAERQRLYRARLADKRRPEEVDRAVAEAVSQVFLELERSSVRSAAESKALGTIIRAAREILINGGYDQIQSADKLQRRMRRKAWMTVDQGPSRGDI